VLEIAVTDVAHLDAVVSSFCALGETSTSIILKTLREHHRDAAGAPRGARAVRGRATFHPQLTR
jgi:Lrp/AsnC family transcriptional regulator, leucine-responsive regulatory protein